MVLFSLFYSTVSPCFSFFVFVVVLVVLPVCTLVSFVLYWWISFFISFVFWVNLFYFIFVELI